jgi:hypothetical protein
MKTVGRWSLARLCAGAVASLLLGGLAPPAARAECGGHVLASSAGPVAGPGAGPTRPAPLRPPPRCTGPGCSCRTSENLPATTPHVLPGLDHWVFLTGAPVPELPRVAFTLPGQPGGHPTRHPSAVYHPPRAFLL